MAPMNDDLKPPWPDIVISCGRRSAPFALAVKRASGGRTLIVHVQDPRARRDRFDLIVAMDHDRLSAGPKVMKIATALHDITPHVLAEAAKQWSHRLLPLGQPLVGVCVGGDLRGRAFSTADGDRLVGGLQRLREQTGAGLAITTSRRTPAAVRRLLSQAFEGDTSVFVWDLTGSNPYRGILALSDRLVVTTDSVSMVSEAIATGRPVELFDLEFPRHRGFVQGFIDQGLACRFTGAALDFAPQPHQDSTQEVAARVLGLVQPATG